MKVINYEEKPETEEEARRRKEELEKAAAVKDKKKAPPPKGGKEEEEETVMVKRVVLSSMDMGFLMPAFSKWATSQFQFAKDRTLVDIETKEPIWKRIYPQEDGVPVVSHSGKYWVRIRFMDKERLVEIDDRMPCDNRKRPLFPQSVDRFEIWPSLILKAYLKVYGYKWYEGSAKEPEVGDGTLLYSLTGLLPERIKLDNFDK